ncbi:MAG: class 1 isoprenoid biosynthesis enzyme [Gammaproteobacteria bacterium]|nr:class 1 isoprenoid biosynthesis enzyme [Gammaproteobacteria bacterium]
MADFEFLFKIGVFKKSISEQQEVLADYWTKGSEIVAGSGINPLPMPKAWASLKRNYFSILFIAIFHILEIPEPRIRLYSRLNHCLRAWVTACDNLLDDELKEMFLTDLPESAQIFKSVHTLLVVDRIFFQFLLDAKKEGAISDEEMERLLKISLNSMVASGVEEANEEQGVEYNLTPQQVLDEVHIYKTGHLFTSPLVAPFELGDIEDPVQGEAIKDGLLNFGLGCQILDDLTDLGMDLACRKHNYIIAVAMQGAERSEKEFLLQLMASESDAFFRDDIKLYRKFPKATRLAQAEANERFEYALQRLSEGGLPMSKTNRVLFIKTLSALLGYPELLAKIRG